MDLLFQLPAQGLLSRVLYTAGPQEAGITHAPPVPDSGLAPHRKIHQGQNDAEH